MMEFRRKDWVGFLLLIPLFLIGSCDGGGGESTTPPPPTVTTTAATGITVHTAILNGTVNPNAQATTAVFEWGTDSTLTSHASTPAQAIGAGTTDQTVSATITGLTLGTTYYYRVTATNASGTQEGTIANFTTALPNSPPAVTTDAATSITISAAVLNGTVNPNELSTTAHFEYGTDSTLTTPTLTPDQPIGAGTTSVAITASLPGLIPGTTYYFRAVSTNSAGTSEGLIVSFNTIALPPPPTVTTTAATGITVHTAILNGTVNPNAQATTAVFEWGTDSTLTSPASTPAQAIGAGATDQTVSATIIGLTLGTTYYYRVAATNASGTQEGTIANFTTALPNSPPAVTTDAATSITISAADLNGTVNPNELSTTAHFEYGIDATLASPILTPAQAIGAGTTSVAITASLPGLVPGTTYYFRVVSTNSAGTSEGAILNYDTIALPPTVTTAAATSITTNNATLNGTVNPNGLATNAHFEYGTDSTLTTPTLTPDQPIGDGFTGQSITASLPGLTPGTMYYFRVVATNSAGTSEGLIVSFNTDAQPPTVATAAATSITINSATLNGTVNPNEVATDAHFEYGTDSTLTSPTLTLDQAIGAGTADVPITASLTGLTPGTTNYFRVVATNSAGTSQGLILSFNTNLLFDDFSTDTSGSYTWGGFNLGDGTPSLIPQFNYDSAGQQLEILTGDNLGLTFSHALLPVNDNGVFSFDFFPRQTYPTGGGIWVRLKQDANNYYEIAAFEWDDELLPGLFSSGVTKWVGGIEVENVAFTNVNNYVSQDPIPTQYHVTITFTPTMTTVQAFGETIVLNTDIMPINVSMFEIQMNQQDAYIDKIELLVVP